jgi:chemotaxis protein CheX
VDFERESIAGIVTTVFQTVLSLDAEVEGTPGLIRRGDDWTGYIQITGDWQGVLTLRCPRDLALEVAAIMFARDRDDVSPRLVRDALGELLNMVAGNIKALVPGQEHRAATPTVVEGEATGPSIAASEFVGEVGFSCGGQPLVVALRESIHH